MPGDPRCRAAARQRGSAEDHIRVFHAAVAQLLYNEAGALTGEKVLIRADSAGASRKFLRHLHNLGVQFSTSCTPR